jgi:hypothetical protein
MPFPSTVALRTHKARPAFAQPLTAHSPTPRFVPVPVPQPVNTTLALATILGAQAIGNITTAGKIIFHCVGDTGGINGVDVQQAVSDAMETQVTLDANGLPDGNGVSFFYHLGDVVYYNGLSTDYNQQFYEPYRFYKAAILAIPGNHDGDTKIQKGDQPDTEPSLYGFMRNFCDAQRESLDGYRDTMTQPYVYWVLTAPFVTIIGLYGNVDGTLDGRGTAVQQEWLAAQLRQADPTTCLIIAVHQPPFSLDGTHGGYQAILDAIDQAATDSGVWPHAVLSGHVHDYQRFTRTITDANGSRRIPYIIAGAGGYANTSRLLHRLQRAANRSPVPCPMDVQQVQGAIGPIDLSLRGYNEIAAGYLRLTIDVETLTIEYFTVPIDPNGTGGLFDAVTLNYRTGTVTTEMNAGTTGAAP